VNPLPVLRTLAGGVRDWALAAPKLLPLAVPGILVGILVAVAAAQALPVFDDHLFDAPSFIRVLALCACVIAFGALFFSALSWVWLACDRSFFSASDWIDQPLACVSVAVLCLAPVGGLAFASWIALLALGPRLGGPPQLDLELLWPPAQMPRAYALVVGGAFLISMPLLLRLFYAPVAAAVERGETRAAWETIMRLTRGKTPALLIATAPQVALLVVAVAVTAKAVSAPGVASLPLLAIACLVFSLVASLQVLVLRHFIGSAPAGEMVERDFEVAGADREDGQADGPGKRARAELPDLPEGLRPKAKKESQGEARRGPSLAEIAAQALDQPAAGERGDAEDAASDFFADVAAKQASDGDEEASGAKPPQDEEERRPAAKLSLEQPKPKTQERPSLTEYLMETREERLVPPAPSPAKDRGDGRERAQSPQPAAPAPAQPPRPAPGPQPGSSEGGAASQPPRFPGLDGDE